jgi:tetratricopeptide (TPR) repeat protein
LAYRSGLYTDALPHVNRVLEVDAYDAEANFLAGTIYRALGQTADARDAFGWATRSTGTRSAAYAQLAAVMLTERDYEEAVRYAQLAIDFDRYSVSGWRALAVVGRVTDNASLAEEARRELQGLDPLDRFSLAERYLDEMSPMTARGLAEAMGGEFPAQTLLELATVYHDFGMDGAALTLLALPTEWEKRPVLDAWRAYLSGDAGPLAQTSDPAFVFPFRRETLDVMQWAAEQNQHWSWEYYRALNLWAVGRTDEAGDALAGLGDTPNLPAFYVARGRLLQDLRGRDGTADHRRAVALAPDDRLMHVALAQHLESSGDWTASLDALDEARSRFPGDFNLALFEARALVHGRRPAEALDILSAVNVLPSEHARGTRQLYADAHTLMALDGMEEDQHSAARGHLRQALEWPESLGEGRPYEPEERLVQFLLGLVEREIEGGDAGLEHFQAVINATPVGNAPPGSLDRLGAAARRVVAEGVGDPRRAGAATAEPEPLQDELVRRALALAGVR